MGDAMTARRPIRLALGLAAAMLAAACSLPPFEASRPGSLRADVGTQGFRGPYMARPRRVGAENPWAQVTVPGRVRICYGSTFSTPEEVLAAAREYCPAPGHHLKLSGQSTFWNGCPLLQPHLASFQCEPAAGE